MMTSGFNNEQWKFTMENGIYIYILGSLGWFQMFTGNHGFDLIMNIMEV